MPTGRDDILRKIDFLREVSDQDLRALAVDCEARSLAQDESLFEEGDPGDSMYIIISGRLRVAKHGVALAVRGAGEYIGEMALVEALPRSASVSAEQSAQLMEITREQFQQKLANSPRALMAILKTLSGRARENLQIFEGPGDNAAGVQEQKLKFLMQEAGLTPREADVAYQICDGRSDKLIARRLEMSPHTVKDHLKKIYAKFRVNSRAQLVALMHQ